MNNLKHFGVYVATLFGTWIVVACIAWLYGAGPLVSAQPADQPTAEQLAQQIERAQVLVPHTRTWQAIELTRDSRLLNRVRVDVVETAGVCLYVARAYAGDHLPPAIAAVPKTALPPGTGCQ